MKVYINNRNYLTWPKNMSEILLNQNHEVIIVDNNSSYQPLIDWYEKQKDIDIVRLNINVGHTAPWALNIVDNSDYYVVTDPDLCISSVPNDWDSILIEGIKKFSATKCGLSLSENNIPKENPAWILDRFCDYPNGDNPITWGDHIKLDKFFINFPTDTTFAIYSPGQWYHIGGIRSNKPYTAKHLPWYIVLNKNENLNEFQIEMNDEMYFYFKNSSDVSTTKHRMKKMISEYEIKNQIKL